MKAFIEDILEDRYIVRVENNKYFELPLITYKDYNFKRNIEISGELRYDKRKNTEYFEPKHPIYKINDKIDFQIIDMVIWEGKTYFVVKDCFENELRVHSLKWDKKETNRKTHLRCEVFDIKFGRPLLKNIDYSHPIYEIGKEFNFEFIGLESKILKDGRPFDIIKLKGEDGCYHETIPLPSQYGHKFKPKVLRCKVIEITAYLKLEQTSHIDPYFATIEKIVGTQTQLLDKYFYNLKENNEYLELFKQYESSSSLWTITYCSKVLPTLINHAVINFNFKEAISIIDILLNIEQWILRSGLLDSFKKETTKNLIKNKSEQIIEKFRVMRITFEFIISNTINLTSLSDIHEKSLVLSFYLKFNKPALIDYVSLFNSVREIISLNKTEPLKQYEINYLLESIEFQKYKLKKDEIETDFTIGKNSRLPFESTEHLNIFLKYIVLQAFLSDKSIKRNIYLGEFFKYLSFLYNTDTEKKNCFKLSYQIINNNECCIDYDPQLLSSLDNLVYISNSITSTFETTIKPVEKDDWKELIEIKKDEKFISIQLKKRNIFGFVGFYKGIYCILPNSNLNSSKLKNYNESECNILLNVSILETFYNFNTILVKELPIEDLDYKLENVNNKNIKVGDILKCRVKSTTTYGVFLTSFAGEGLLHIQNITDLFIDVSLNQIFKIGEEINVCILNKRTDNNLEFGLKQLKGTKYEDDFNEIEFRIFAPELPNNDLIDSKMIKIDSDLNKQLFIQGHIFEYFSNLQYDFDGKIKYLKLSKVYYSTIQSSRSYFLNTYISYFEILNSIEVTLQEKSKEILDITIENARLLLLQLEKNTVTIEKFPSIYRLIFFLDILQQFNNTTVDSIQSITSYLLDKKYEEYTNLSKVAKVVLSNNLIVSEKEDYDFMFKNLRILYQYLKDGIFDINENDHEKRERELKERIAVIRNKIFNEESEKVEFKSSLIKPILDSQRKKKLFELEKKKDALSKNEIDNLIGKPAKNRVLHSAMKTLVAFANSKGGTLFIGINDDGEFVGLDYDYEEIGIASRDELGKKLDDYIKNYIGNSFFGLVSIQFESIDNKDILIIEVKSSTDEVFLLKDDKSLDTSDFYIRRHSSSVKLTGKELIEYYKWRFEKPTA